MIKLYPNGVYIRNGNEVVLPDESAEASLNQQGLMDQGRRQTISHSVLGSHNVSPIPEDLVLGQIGLRVKFDALASHDITYVGIVQTARASGLEEFPVPYVLTNCHNSLCAVGGTINEDDHLFGLSVAKKYGGIYIPAHQAVIHQYMREIMAGCGKMILGSDSHTRYGPLGTMAVGEGGPELVKQLMGRTYDIPYPQVVAVWLTGKPQPGVGPQDVALAIIKAVFANGFVKNKVMEFVGDGIANLNMDYRMGIDVMTTETTCLTSIWQTDTVVRDYLLLHGRACDYAELKPGPLAYYDSMILVDLSAIRPMIALPFHPSNAYTIAELETDLADILRETEKAAAMQSDRPDLPLRLTDKIIDGVLHVDQGIIAGCAGGTYDNIAEAAYILHGSSVGCEAFALSVYPASQPIMMRLTETGALSSLLAAGATVRTAFCGPCFGAGDVPAHNGFSIRHTTRNFPNREGSKPDDGQIAAVALMDARSIAATAKNGGRLTAAGENARSKPVYTFNNTPYANRVYNGVGRPRHSFPLALGPNIADWPVIPALSDHLLLKVASVITDDVTTTDELIPSGETSSYRSNPEKLASFTLSRKDPGYVPLAKAVRSLAQVWRENGTDVISDITANTADPGATDNVSAELRTELATILDVVKAVLSNGNGDRTFELNADSVGIGTLVFANKPGDGSAREQAASCQKVLGTWANIAREYATKRYRSNLINWGLLPLLLEQTPENASSSETPFTTEALPFHTGDWLFIPGIRTICEQSLSSVTAYIISSDTSSCLPLHLSLGELTDEERCIILAGCLMNHYRT
ncbi:MAG: hydratase [Peptococcaceae bacterium]|nr:hydratase [Peptococcaceae bacterium]